MTNAKPATFLYKATMPFWNVTNQHGVIFNQPDCSLHQEERENSNNTSLQLLQKFVPILCPAFEKIFGPKRDDVTVEWISYIARNFLLFFFYFSQNIIWVINSRRTRWAGYVERMGRGEVPTGLCCGNLTDRDHLEELGIEDIMLKWISKVWDGVDWSGSG